MEMAWQGHVEVDPGVVFGKPVVAGTRIPVYMVLELVEAGYTPQQIVADFYPTLTEEDVRACIRYATELAKNEEIYFASEVAAAPAG
jgi:uncharacterized protein (DUF433 family)